jgi:hypothetical protein
MPAANVTITNHALSPGGGEKTSADGPPGIMVKDEYDNELNADDLPLTLSTTDTTGKEVKATITGAPAGFDYLIWVITPEGGAATLGVVESDKPEPASKHPVIVPKTAGTATVTVINCNSGGVWGTLTASFTVKVVGGVVVQYWTDNTATLATNTGQATLSRGAGQSALITGTGGYSEYQWFLNGTVIAGSEGAATYTFASAGRDTGIYTIGLRVQKNGAWYSTNITITVTN